jgi:hypothetical protein
MGGFYHWLRMEGMKKGMKGGKGFDQDFTAATNSQ